MDPLTAALTLASDIVKLITVAIESQPPELRAEFAKAQLEGLKRWQDFLDRVTKQVGAKEG